MKKGLFTVLTALFIFSASMPAYAKRSQSVKTYGQVLCQHPNLYRCIKVKRHDTWEKLFPNPKERNLVRRLNRMNIPLRPGMRIAVPKDADKLEFFAISPFPKLIKAPGEETIVFDPRKLAWGAYDAEGELVRWGPASGGSTWCPDVRRGCRTARGQFAMYAKKGVTCKSGKYPLPKGGAPMPYCMFFFRGFGMHASPTVPGYNASHGCIRIFKEDAKWLNQQFIDIQKNKGRTQVIVLPYGSIDVSGHMNENQYDSKTFNAGK